MKLYNNDFKEKHLLIIKEEIEAYQKGKIHFYELKYVIDSAISFLIDIIGEWEQDLRSYCLEIEIIYAFSLEREELIIEEEKELASILCALNHFVDEKLKEDQEKLLKKLEFPDPENTIIAKDLGDNWLMCPICIDAWQTDSRKGMVVCPLCNNIMHNSYFQNA